jgi:hypothetical protein
MTNRPVTALALTFALAVLGCDSGGKMRPGGSGGSSAGGSGGSTGGSGGSTGGSGGGSLGGSGGSSGSGGSGARDGGGGMSTPAAMYFKSVCACPVLTGFKPQEFCEAYTEICGYMGAGRYASEMDCLSKFKGGASDADGRKAGALCCAYMMPAMKEARCAAAGPGGS